jgi:hypothetical protein
LDEGDAIYFKDHWQDSKPRPIHLHTTFLPPEQRAGVAFKNLKNKGRAAYLIYTATIL